MTTSDHSNRAPGLLDTVYEMVSSVGGTENKERSIVFHLYTPTNTFQNEANSASGGAEIIRSESLKKSNQDSTSKRARIQAAFSSRHNSTEKKTNSTLTDSVGVFSQNTNNTSGPGGGGSANNEATRDSEQPNVVAALSLHTNTATPVASLGTASSGKSQSTAKEFLTRRVRSRSKTDAESVTEKSLFSKIFSKKSKKPTKSLITTTTNSIELDVNSKGVNIINKSSLTNKEPRSTIDEEEYDYDYDDALEQSNMSIGFLSDTDNRNKNGTQATTRVRPAPIKLPQSDSQYYASMSSAPTGFSISYHKRMTKGNDDLRLQTAINRHKGVAGDGANQLMVGSVSYMKHFFFLLVLYPSVHSIGNSPI